MALRLALKQSAKLNIHLNDLNFIFEHLNHITCP